jgi:hypothetical protein
MLPQNLQMETASSPKRQKLFANRRGIISQKTGNFQRRYEFLESGGELFLYLRRDSAATLTSALLCGQAYTAG